MIIDVQTGNMVDVCFRELKKADTRKYKLNKKNGWFTWSTEFKPDNRVFGMFILGENDIQGLISLQNLDNEYMYISLMEASPINQYNNMHRRYEGVGKNLLCFAISQSFDLGLEGYVGLHAKKNYNEKYYQDLKAVCTHVMDGRPFYAFFPDKSLYLLNKYMPGGVKICQN